MTNKVLKSAIIQKEKNNEILITSILIALGINIFTTGILGFFNIESKYLLLIIVGSIFCLSILLCYSISKIKKNNQEIKIEGLVIYDKVSNKIIKIPEYRISEDIVRCLNGSFVENKALDKKWQSGYIGLNISKYNNNAKKNNNNNIVIELIEYLFLSKLSIELEDYYNINDIKDKDINSLSFDEMPVILRKNRFLKLFSEDMDNRAEFVKTNQPKSNGEIVYAISENGAIFERFNLKLPKEVKIVKDDLNKLKFITKYFTLNIEYIFDGTSSVIDYEFYNYYLNKEKDYKKFGDFKFNIKINIEIHNRIIFSKKKIQNYMWLDNLLNNLIEYADVEEYFRKINWEGIKSLMRCFKNMIIKGRKVNEW